MWSSYVRLWNMTAWCRGKNVRCACVRRCKDMSDGQVIFQRPGVWVSILNCWISMKFGIGLNITVCTAYHFVPHQWSVAIVLAVQIPTLTNVYPDLFFFTRVLKISEMWTRITHIEWLGYKCADLYLSAAYVFISWYCIKHRGFCTFTAVKIADVFHHMIKKLPAFFFNPRMVYHCMQERPAVESSLERTLCFFR